MLNYQPKASQAEEPLVAIAAENDLEYRKKPLSLSPKTDKKA